MKLALILPAAGELSLPDRLAPGWEVGTLFGTRVDGSSGVAPFYRNPLRRGALKMPHSLRTIVQSKVKLVYGSVAKWNWKVTAYPVTQKQP